MTAQLMARRRAPSDRLRQRSGRHEAIVDEMRKRPASIAREVAALRTTIAGLEPHRATDATGFWPGGRI